MITYNHEKYIAEAIEGVLMQEVDFEIELIIADDASTDTTGEIVQSYIDTHSRGSWIKYTRHPVNKGMMGNFIWALEQCKGEYIALCEGDDYWIELWKLKKQVNFLTDNPSFSLVSHVSKKISFKNSGFSLFGNLSRDIYQLEDHDYHFLAIPTASIVFRNQIAFPEWMKLVYAGDRALIFLASQAGKIKVMDFVGAVYRVHENGIEQGFKKDKFSLPKRNLMELPVYFEMATGPFKKYIAKKISWNNFYLSLQYARIFSITNIFSYLVKSIYWKIISL